MKHQEILFCFLVASVSFINCASIEEEEIKASKLMQELNAKHIIEANKMATANWNYESNMTQANEDVKIEVQKANAEFAKNNALKLLSFRIDDFKNETLKRMVKKIINIGDAILDEPEFTELKQAILKMQTNYATTKVPSFEDKNVLFSLEPEITRIFETSTNPDELKYYWEKWHDLAGKPSRKEFWKYVNLRNQAAWKNSECDDKSFSRFIHKSSD